MLYEFISSPHRASGSIGARSASGQLRHFGCVPVTSGLPPTPDMPLHGNN
jgi:hypothetical protein